MKCNCCFIGLVRAQLHAFNCRRWLLDVPAEHSEPLGLSHAWRPRTIMIAVAAEVVANARPTPHATHVALHGATIAMYGRACAGNATDPDLLLQTQANLYQEWEDQEEMAGSRTHESVILILDIATEHVEPLLQSMTNLISFAWLRRLALITLVIRNLNGRQEF